MIRTFFGTLLLLLALSLSSGCEFVQPSTDEGVLQTEVAELRRAAIEAEDRIATLEAKAVALETTEAEVEQLRTKVVKLPTPTMEKPTPISPPSSPTNTRVVSPTASPASVPTELPTATWTAIVTPALPITACFKVGNTDGDGVYIRRTPDMGDKIKAWSDDTVMVVIGEDTVVSEQTWKNVRDPAGNEGWVPAQYLLPLAACPPAATVSPSGATATPTGSSETTQIQVYFARLTDNDVEFVPVLRQVQTTEDVGSTALKELLKGPTEAEKGQGLYNPIPEGTELLSLAIKEGVAYADFDARIEGGGSLRVRAIWGVVTSTLKQLSTVKEVIILVEGRAGRLEP